MGAAMDAFKLMKELRTNYEQEINFLPKEAGLSLIESTTKKERGVSARCRDLQVEDLWSLSSFFGYSTLTFVRAVSLLDRFLATMRIQPKHLSCVSLSCLHLASRVTEAACDVAPADELIRIGQRRFTASDLGRMEQIVARKLEPTPSAVTAVAFLRLYLQVAASHGSDRKETTLSLDKLEAQLKACLCRICFSRAKPSVLALALLIQEIQAVQAQDTLEIARHIQRHLKISEAELQHWSVLVAQCLADYASPACSKPDHRRLVWVVSRRTAQNLQSSYCSVPHLPTIPEGCWDACESEDSSEDLSSGEESLSSSLGSDAEGPYFPLHLRQKHLRP